MKENHTMTTPIKKLMLAMVAATLLCLGARAANEDKTWMVVDLRTGALSYYGYDLAWRKNAALSPAAAALVETVRVLSSGRQT